MQRMFLRGSLALVMCLVLLAGTVGSVAASSGLETGQALRQTMPYAMTNGAINVRGGPGVGFWILGYLNAAEVVPISGVSPDGAWWYVETRFGLGWVAGISVTAYNTTDVEIYDPGLIGSIGAGVLNVRSGAGGNAVSLGHLTRGQQVFIQAQSADGNWLQIQWAYGTGWVSRAYVVTDGFAGVIADEDEVEVTSDKAYATITATYLNVRSGPGTNYSSIGFVYNGEELVIVGRSADSSWYQLETRYGTGWVSAAYLLTRNEYGGTPITSDMADEADKINPVFIVNTGAAHVRSGPGTQYTSLGSLAGGAQGEIIGRSADWAWWLAETDLGTGWVSASLVAAQGNTIGVPYVEPATVAAGVEDGQGGYEVPPAELALPEAVVTTGALFIRSGPNSVFDALGSVSTGEAMTIIGQSPDRGWWLVVSPFGEGWISKAFVTTRGNVSTVPVVQ